MKVDYFRAIFTLLSITLIWACAPTVEESSQVETVDMLAERYVKTILRLGQYDNDIVDAYYGPEEWRPTTPAADSLPGEKFLRELRLIQQGLANQDTTGLPKQEKQRLVMFQKQVLAAITKVEMMQGKELSFDKEARLLYDANPPHYEFAYFDSLLNMLHEELPGEGPLAERWTAYQRRFEIPKEKLDTVFQAAIGEARRRTKAHYKLPENENFRVEYVTDKPWSGYNYFKGNGYSLIQINTDFPVRIERAIDLAGHEGYPGHHVFNTLLEQELVNKRGWKEFSIYPLFSPQSLIAEGSANYGVDVAFPATERLKFEQEVLFPLAGLDPSEAEQYYQVLDKINQLNFAGNEVARLYRNGKISREEAADLLVKYNFYEKEKALQRTRFMDRYRSYVINYNLGQELVKAYVEANGGTADNPEKRWEVFRELLSNPHTASMLQE
ncbi:hypothetical protein CLV24_105242 [Pontibacter ummariensis]|uniref:DUF885 domain-containing protein n=1 Tax=Pontibacter ummariensis TaxID=1610492 RepID=A0A239DMU5_9BACT|nr:hypothetical protein [Pontibacter ummariensis]PRY13872.1 hypothetical protein CLV24_105242 [Pontibacter ummariensis]SNS33112.1 hypothetical protein SAMN06296052_10510 [Pontibacter ummariensis]